MSRIYVASSWRNEYQPAVVLALRESGHEVYDFRNPAPGEHGFHWSAIDPAWRGWTTDEYRAALAHPIAVKGFGSDWAGMTWAEVGVLVLPSGRSAHLEAGYFVGSGKPLHILLKFPQEPELMYLMATTVSLSIGEMLERIASR